MPAGDYSLTGNYYFSELVSSLIMLLLVLEAEEYHQ